jgi:hypothetical protein
MTSRQINFLRLFNQNISRTTFKKPHELVSWMGAIQAQDYAMAKWGIGLRLKNSSDDQVERAINDGTIVRTHLMRPTWHFVSAKDVRWILQLTAPNIHKITKTYNKNLELDEKIFRKSNKIICRLLEGGQHKSRNEIMTELQKNKFIITPLRAAHLMFRAELDQIVCNGPRRNKEFTYALLDERIPKSGKEFLREEALGELALRYFTSHGPATLKDYAWWSGLTMGDARKGLEIIRTNLTTEIVDEVEYWMNPSTSKIVTPSQTVFLLPAFDEYAVAYRDRSTTHNPIHVINNGYGILSPLVIIDGKISGTWKRQEKKDKVEIQITPFMSFRKKNISEINNAAGAFGDFLNKKVVTVFVE